MLGSVKTLMLRNGGGVVPYEGYCVKQLYNLPECIANLVYNPSAVADNRSVNASAVRFCYTCPSARHGSGGICSAPKVGRHSRVDDYVVRTDTPRVVRPSPCVGCHNGYIQVEAQAFPWVGLVEVFLLMLWVVVP